MAQINEKELNVRVLLYQEEGQWIAQGIEWDINAHGHTIEAAQKSFFETFVCAIIANLENHRGPLTGLKEAPAVFRHRFESGEALKDPASYRLPPDVNLPAPHMLRAVEAERRIEA